ncbi:ATP-binding cassette domain-containing protein, partial [bacterium]|nr:ATP-binding cassette domain-containing protein [bacterium]
MIEVDSVSKNFGAVQALNQVSFKVDQGEIIGLLGPNGAGKTTMMRILSCFMPPSSGKVRIAGLDASRHSLAIRAKTGYFLERVSIYPEMRVGSFLEFVASIKGSRDRTPKQEAARVMKLCGLGLMSHRII